jgi:lysophospholipid acyltransferase
MLVARKQCGRLAWLVDFSYLIACHVASASGSAWKEGKMDFTGSQMIVTLKIISAAVTYQDGLKHEKDLTAYQQAHKLRGMPNLLEYLSYVFASGNLLAGPTFELSDYLTFIEKGGSWSPKAARQMPSPVVPGLLRFAKALLCMALHLWLVKHFSADVFETAWFYGLSLPMRAGVFWVVGLVARFKYYFAWTVSEAGLIFSGFCFNGFSDSGSARWDRYSNARIRHVELCTSLAELPVSWNTCTGNFLRQYVYERLTPKGGRAPFYVMLVTQTVSAVWHGLFPGYGMFFITSAFMFEASKAIFRYERAYAPSSGLLNHRTFPPWLAVKWAFTAFVLNYAASTFLLIDFWPGWQAWRSVYFLGHVMILGIMGVSIVFPPPHKPKGKQAPAAEPKLGKAQ